MMTESLEEIFYLNWANYALIQRRDLPRFTLDSVLLADFMDVQPQTTIVDLGTGTGIIPLLLLGKEKQLMIKAIELMKPMVELAEKNVRINSLNAQIEIVEADLCTASAVLGKSCWDMVCSNPPYFKKGQTKNSNNPMTGAARSELYCSLEDVIREAALLLKYKGSFFLVHRPERLPEIMWLLEKYKLCPSVLRLSHPNSSKIANTCLIRAEKGIKKTLKVLPPLFVHGANNQYSEEMDFIFKRGAE